MKNIFKIGVFGIVTDMENRIMLVLRNDCDFWNLPGGELNTGETLLEGCRREVNEETGLIVKAEKLIGVYNKPFLDEVVFTFQCSIIEGVLTINEEAKEIRYFSQHDIPSNTLTNHKERVKDFYENKVGTIIKKQTSEI